MKLTKFKAPLVMDSIVAQKLCLASAPIKKIYLFGRPHAGGRHVTPV